MLNEIAVIFLAENSRSRNAPFQAFTVFTSTLKLSDTMETVETLEVTVRFVKL